MPLNIRINDYYKITSDSYNVIANRKYIVDPTKAPNWTKREAEGADPTPREEWREVAYFPKFENAVAWLLDQGIRDSNADSLLGLSDDIARFKLEIKALETRLASGNTISIQR